MIGWIPNLRVDSVVSLLYSCAESLSTLPYLTQPAPRTHSLLYNTVNTMLTSVLQTTRIPNYSIVVPVEAKGAALVFSATRTL
jgi:hypothetical protein